MCVCVLSVCVCLNMVSMPTLCWLASLACVALHGSPIHTFHTQFEVWLSKEPSGVGFSITSGRDTAGSSRPGDKVSPLLWQALCLTPSQLGLWDLPRVTRLSGCRGVASPIV